LGGARPMSPLPDRRPNRRRKTPVARAKPARPYGNRFSSGAFSPRTRAGLQACRRQRRRYGGAGPHHPNHTGGGMQAGGGCMPVAGCMSAPPTVAAGAMQVGGGGRGGTGRSADGKGDEDSEGGHQELRLRNSPVCITIPPANRQRGDPGTDHDANSEAKRGFNSEHNPGQGAPHQEPTIAANADMRMTTVGPSRCGKAPDFGLPLQCPKPSRTRTARRWRALFRGKGCSIW